MRTFNLSLRRITILSVLIFFAANLSAQIPAKCFEIESILVDACVPGSGCTNSASPACNCEGKNEMVRFRTGPSAINITGISITWPNNTYQGLVQNALTAQLTSQLNATIMSCGHLVEPVGGIIPAGKEVLLISSTDMCVTANSFTNLTDTLYLIFQNPNNFQGHFANTNNTATITTIPTGASSTRTLIMRYTPSGCSDTVTYDRALLVNVLGTYGGSSAQNDGATVLFSWPGTPIATYVNYGCQAPFVPLAAFATGGGNVCSNGTINLSGTASGSFSSVHWSGGTGFFSPANSANTVYTAGAGDNGNTVLTFSVHGVCNDSATTTVSINVIPAAIAQIAAGGPTTFCTGGNVTLTASGGTSYLWSNTATTSAITVNAAGTYTVMATNTCGNDTEAITVNVLPLPVAQISASGPTTFCVGGNVTLSASGGNNYLWNTSASTPSITVTTAGTYTVTVSTTCGSDTQTIAVNVLPLPNASIIANGPTSICQGDSVQLIASGGNSYSWSSGPTSSSIYVGAAGNYIVTATNSCGTDSAQISITIQPNPVAVISGSAFICNGDSATLTASGANNFLWSNGATSNSIIVTAQGNYFVIASNACGVDTSFLTVNVDQVNAGFFANVYTGISPLPVNFTNSSSSNVTTWQWNFGDNSAGSNSINPSYSYNTPGTFVVILTASDAAGCSDTAIATIVVNDIPSLVTIPNVFTPNADGVNDNFFVSTIGIREFKLQIFDRWGALLFASESPLIGWDGRTTSGNIATDGTYYYVLNAIGFDNKKYNLTGYLTLLK
ncbi:MAG: gliding motility-associated C-terminal domain-containing protein [Bacteroidetes bacterium]|nr:gliding motility-associated C-terminal domain-containing protein [Bacteroidota bacterium]